MELRKVGNIYPSKGEAGNVYHETGISPTIRCNGEGGQQVPLVQVTAGSIRIRVWDGYNKAFRKDNLAGSLKTVQGATTGNVIIIDHWDRMI